MFACSGYCGSTFSSHGPIVIEPSQDTFSYLLKQLKFGSSDILIELHYFFNLDSCPQHILNEYIVDSSSVQRVYETHVVTPVAQDIGICKKFQVSPLSTCHRLPLHFGVPSSNFSVYSYARDLICTGCDFYPPRLVVYPRDSPTWESVLLTDKAILWRWYDVRSSIPMTVKSRSDSLVAFSAPAMLLLGMLLAFRYFQVTLMASTLSLSSDGKADTSNLEAHGALPLRQDVDTWTEVPTDSEGDPPPGRLHSVPASPLQPPPPTRSVTLRRTPSMSCASSKEAEYSKEEHSKFNSNLESPYHGLSVASSSHSHTHSHNHNYNYRGESPEPSPSSTITVVFNFLKLFANVIMCSTWYHLSQMVGRHAASPQWFPLTALSVSLMWTVLSLVTGFTMIDNFYISFRFPKQSISRRRLLELGAVCLAVLLAHVLEWATSDTILAVAVSSFSILCIYQYLRYSSSAAVLKESFSIGNHAAISSHSFLSKEDLLLFLWLSLTHSFLTYLLCILPLPEGIRFTSLRVFGIMFAIAVVVMLICASYHIHIYSTLTRYKELVLDNMAPPVGHSGASATVAGGRWGGRWQSFLCDSLVDSDDGDSNDNCRNIRKLLSLIKRKKLLVITVLCVLASALFIMVVFVNVLFSSWTTNLPNTRPYFCLKQNHRYINPSNGGFSNACGAAEAIVLVDTHVFVETFSETYKCMQVYHRSDEQDSNGNGNGVEKGEGRAGLQSRAKTDHRYLTKRRETVQSCTVASAGVLFIVNKDHDGAREGYCLYSSRDGEFLSSLNEPQFACKNTEKWHVIPTHQWTYIWSVLSSFVSPFFRYDFASERPLVSALLALAMYLANTQVGLHDSDCNCASCAAHSRVMLKMLRAYCCYMLHLTLVAKIVTFFIIHASFLLI